MWAFLRVCVNFQMEKNRYLYKNCLGAIKATICSTRYVSEKHFLAKTFHFITFLTFLNHQVNKTPWFTKKR